MCKLPTTKRCLSTRSKALRRASSLRTTISGSSLLTATLFPRPSDLRLSLHGGEGASGSFGYPSAMSAYVRIKIVKFLLVRISPKWEVGYV